MSPYVLRGTPSFYLGDVGIPAHWNQRAANCFRRCWEGKGVLTSFIKVPGTVSGPVDIIVTRMLPLLEEGEGGARNQLMAMRRTYSLIAGNAG